MLKAFACNNGTDIFLIFTIFHLQTAIPTKAEIHQIEPLNWIPAFAGMTIHFHRNKIA